MHVFGTEEPYSLACCCGNGGICHVSGSSRDLCVALDPRWVQVTWFSQRAWSSMAVPVCVYASQPLRVGLLRAGWFRNDWHVPNVLY